MTLLARRDDVAVDAFRAHWAGHHAELALSLAGVSKYMQNRVEEVLWVRTDGGEAFRLDGIAELYFTDEAAMAKAQASTTGATLIPNDEHLFLSGWTLCIVETSGVQEREGSKVIVPIALTPGVLQADAVGMILQAIETQNSGIIAHCINCVMHTASRSQLWSEPITPDLLLVFWLAGPQYTAALFERDSPLRNVLDHQASKGTACRVDVLTLR